MQAADLMRMGCRIRTRHHRFYTPIDNRTRIMDVQPPAQFVGKARARHKPYPRAGITEVDIIFPDGHVVTGQAWCSPKDNYSRRFGHLQALDRAIMLALKQQADKEQDGPTPRRREGSDRVGRGGSDARTLLRDSPRP